MRDRAADKVRSLTWPMAVLGLAVLLVSLAALGARPDRAGASGRYKILHVMSYHSPWEWTDDQLNGFKEALSGLDVEYRVFQMDSKRNSTEALKEKVGREARALIDSRKPDLVYTSDDNAQKYVAMHYVNRDVPIVFSGVNADPQDYGFVGSRNITGVLEQEHAVETVRLLRELVPTVTRIAVVVDDDPTWNGVVRRMKESMTAQLPGVRVASWEVVKSFREYQEKVRRFQSEVDAIGLLGIHTFKDDSGRNVPWQDVLAWTARNSRLPDFSFWKDRIQYGTLCAVYVSGWEQGLAAGKIARAILTQGRRPSDFSMEPTKKGQPILSLARAKALGIKATSRLLLTVKVVEKAGWED